MQHILSRFRYIFEILAVPIFLFLVLHLSGHALVQIFEMLGSHGDHLHEAHDHNVFKEMLWGIVPTALFVWIWHRPMLKKWVPCAHEHCHDGHVWTHILAIVALCLHFFPEAGVRQMMIHEFLTNQNVLSVVSLVGFSAHFFVDIIVALFLSSHWRTWGARIFSFLCITCTWLVAYVWGESIQNSLADEVSIGVTFLSAFVIAMFVHWPHKPVETCCGECSRE